MATEYRGPVKSIDTTTEEPTIGRLVADTTKDFSSLIRNEIELAKTELKFSVKAGGVGAALFGAAAFVALLAIIMLSISFAYFLHWLGFHLALAFLTVFAVYLLIAGVLAYIGLKRVKQVRPPEQTIAAVKSNKQVLKRG
ncbi:MAG: phage holin family protein [Nocardioidaceae bacterium]